MSTREDILLFLRDPVGFASAATDRELWTSGLDQFVMPSINAHQDRPLRFAQEQAWRGLAHQRVGLIMGPPGTGKTHLLSWLVAGHSAVRTANGKPARTFITAFTKNAACNLLEAVASRQAVHDPLAPMPMFYGLPPSSDLSDRIRIVRPGNEAEVGQEIGSGRIVIASTIWGLYRLIGSGALAQTDGPTASLFDLICIDEASQMVLGQALMGLAGMADNCRVVVSGDDQQLPPVRSLRSMQVGTREMGGSLYAFLKSANVAEFALEETFRLNAPLAHFPERQFYPGKYHSAVPTARLNLKNDWPQGLDLLYRLALDPALPIVAIVHEGPAAATSNAFEASIAAHLASKLAERVDYPDGPISREQFWADTAAIVSPHRMQNALIRSMLPPDLKTDAFVETVDRIQGKERDAVILSYCVADPEFALAEAEFIFSPERLNVATTRARTKLIVLISRRLLEAIPSDQETMDKAELIREFVFSCETLQDTIIDGPSGRKVNIQIRARSFEGDKPCLDLTPDQVVQAGKTEMTPELEGVLASIRRIAASSSYGTAPLSEVRKAMALSSPPLPQFQALHHLGWVSLQSRNGKYGVFWLARPFEAARRVYSIDIEEVRARITTIIREERNGKHCFYSQARDRFAWMSDRGDDLLLPVIHQLQLEGLVTLGTVGNAMTIAATPGIEVSDELEEASPTLSSLEDSDFAFLNRLEDLESARINFGVFDNWTSSAQLARFTSKPLDSATTSLARLAEHGYLMLAAEGRVRSRMAELLRELRHVKQRFKADDADSRPYLVRNLKLELRDRRKPIRNQPVRQVFDEAIAQATPTQKTALEGLHQALITLWGEHASLAEFQRQGLLQGLAAWRGTGTPTIVIAAETGSGKTEAAVLPLIAGALGDRLAGIIGTRAILTYPRVRLAANQAQRLARYLAAASSVPNLPLLTLGLQVSDVPDRFENMHVRYRDLWRSVGDQLFEFPFFGCPSCGHPLRLHSGGGSSSADALICSRADWRFDGWIGSKEKLYETPPSLFLPTTDSLHQWLHDPRYGSLFGDDARFAAPRALLADEIHLYTHIHGAQVGLTLRRLAARAETGEGGEPPIVAVGMSATLSDPAEAWGRLMNRDLVSVVGPRIEELQSNPRGREYFFFIQPEVESRGADIAGASTTIQSLMCLAHGMRRRTGNEGGYRSLVFFDSIDKMRRLHGAFTDAEEGKELAALRITQYGDDLLGQPQTRCCSDPVGCDRFADGECWWFAANDARQCGARGRLKTGNPLRVAKSPIYSGTSSDAEALVKGSDVVFATSSLEVGYDDPDITLVYQHYAPQNLASFVQRKGRAGRGVDDRPTTAITLSIYSSRDNWWFRKPSEMLELSGFRIPLNPNNFFVRRGQVLVTLLDGIARTVTRDGEDGMRPTVAVLEEAGRLVETVFGAEVWSEFQTNDAHSFWQAALNAQAAFPVRYFSDLRQGFSWAPQFLFDTVNLPAIKIQGPDVLGGASEDIGFALATIAPGNATRRYNPSVVHWRPPTQGRAPWLSIDDYQQAEMQPLRHDAEALLKELPQEARAQLSAVLPHLCRPIVASLDRIGWMAGAHWTPEVALADSGPFAIVPTNMQSIPLRHDSHASLSGFLLTQADADAAYPLKSLDRMPGLVGVDAFLCGPKNTPSSGIKMARVFWGAEAELRFDRPGVDPMGISQLFVDPASGRPLLHGYQVQTEGLRFNLDMDRVNRFVTATRIELETDEERGLWHRSQFFRYLIETQCQTVSINTYDARMGSALLAAAISQKEFVPKIQRLARFWSPTGLANLFDEVRTQLLSQNPLMTQARVARAAETLANDGFRQILNSALTSMRQPATFGEYLMSSVMHSLALRLKLLVTQVGQGDERKLLAHTQLPLQFGKDATSIITICEAGANGDGTIRGAIDNLQAMLDLVDANYLGACPNADEDAVVRQFWHMKHRHDAWRSVDPRDVVAQTQIAAELNHPKTESRLAPVLRRVLYESIDVEIEQFTLYDIAADIESTRERVLGEKARPMPGWELASVAVLDAATGAAPVLKRLLDAYSSLDPGAEESMGPQARLAEQVFRIAAPLCADGCRSCVHQASDLMADSLTEASVSRSLLQRFLADES